MSQLKDKCVELINRYDEFISKGGPKNVTGKEKLEYINEQYNAINLICKLICISSTGQDPDQQTVSQDKFEKTKNLANNLFRDKKKPINTVTAQEKFVPAAEVKTNSIDVKAEAVNDKTIIAEEPNKEPEKKTDKKSTAAKKTTKSSTAKKAEKSETAADDKKSTKKTTAKKSTTTKKKSTTAKTDKPATAKKSAKKSTPKKTAPKAEPKPPVEDEIEEMDADEFLGGLVGALEGAVLDDKYKDENYKKLTPEERAEKAAKAQKDVDSIEDKTAKDIIVEELNNWGLNPNSLGYKALAAMGDIKIVESDTYKDVVNKIASRLGKTSNSILAALSYIPKAAEFTNSKYIPLFARLASTDRLDEITKESIVSNFKDYCVDED